MRFWEKTTQQPWAITEEALETILSIAARNNERPDTVVSKLGRELSQHYVSATDAGVAEIHVVGPLFKYANLFTLISGATSYERITKDIKTAMQDDAVNTVILNIDSPGGEVNGCSELAQLIYSYRGKKPILAYASGDCASGAYWIASACDQIIAADTACLGSIGVVAIVGKPQGGEGVLEFVSSQSPHKRLNLESKADRLRMQDRVDTLANVFIERVALHRGVSTNVVENEFGQGDTFIGASAVEAGLADEVGSLDGIFQNLGTGIQPTTVTQVTKDNEMLAQHDVEPDISNEEDNEIIQGICMNLDELKATYPEHVGALIQEGKDSERQRIAAIFGADEAQSRQALASHLAFNTELTIEAIQGALAAAPLEVASTPPTEPTPQPTTDFAQVMATITNPDIPPGGDDDSPEEESEDVVAKRIAQMNV